MSLRRVMVLLFYSTMNPLVHAIDFNERPFIAIWEVTQVCDLACVHCRTSAQPSRHPMELSTEKGKHLIDQIAALKVPVFVLTGGDPCCSDIPKGYAQLPLSIRTASTLYVLQVA